MASSFQWRKNGVNIPGATSDSLTINNASASDAGSYDFIISNSCGGEISTPFTLTVYSFTLNPTSQNFGASGSTGIVNVTSSAACPWTAQSNATWITVTSGASGTGNGTVGFNVAANTSAGQRTGTMTIAGQTFTVTQDGLNCSYSINPTSQNFSASGGANSVTVTATAGCAWSVVNNAPSFITVNSGASGSGNGTVNYTVSANSSPARTGTITIAGQTFTVTQDSGCAYSLSAASLNFSSSGGTSPVGVTTNGGCPWTAQSNTPSFITITSGASGTGSGTVNYSVSANSGPQRSGTLTIAGQTFTVTQDSGCTYSIAPTSQNFASSSGAGSVSVTTGGGCTWLVVNNSPSFITINSGASGTGNGTMSYSITANPSTSQRSGTMTIAGQTFTVMQDAAIVGPTIIVEEGSNRIAAIDSVTFVRGPFTLSDDHNFSSDHRTRIIFFTSNLGFSQPTQPDVGLLSVELAGMSFPVETVGPASISGLNASYIVFRLPDLTPGEWPLSVRLRGINSANSPVLSITASSSNPDESVLLSYVLKLFCETR